VQTRGYASESSSEGQGRKNKEVGNHKSGKRVPQGFEDFFTLRAKSSVEWQPGNDNVKAGNKKAKKVPQGFAVFYALRDTLSKTKQAGRFRRGR
jgi:hypothetical protein